MCGVAAAYAYAGGAPAIDRDELRAVRDHMAARGPDGAGEWFSPDGRVGLAHRRLAIIDLSERGAQPMASADGQLVISFNGEIYNYRELRATLQRARRVFRTESDTEVLLQLYEEHGTGMLPMLRGMFAFALWDARSQELLLARDPYGIKPLYYANGSGTLRVASQVKALLHAQVDTAPEPAGHAGFFLWGSVPAPWTLYRGIRTLRPGHFLRVRGGGAMEPECFHDVVGELARASLNPAQVSREEALASLGAALRSSITAHRVSDVPVGVFLSGGLDSALLAAAAAPGGEDLRTLTLAFDEYECSARDEAPHAAALAQSLGSRHSTVRIRRAEFLAAKARLLADMDQPSIDGVNVWLVARAAASVGIKVALSGIGGDELLGSYPSFRQVPRLAEALAPLSRIPAVGLAVRRLSEPLVRHFTSPKYAGLLEYGGSMGGAYLLRRGLHMPWELPRLMDPDMARAGWAALQTMAQLDRTTAGTGGTARARLAVTALESAWYLRHQLLADADWAGMAHSVEIRVPLVDAELLSLAAPLLAAHPTLSKQEVIAAAAPHLPSALFERPKTGFSVPVRQWLGASSRSLRGLRGWSRQVHSSFGTARGGSGRRRILVSTLAPGKGGVSAMTEFAVNVLEESGFEPVIAYYPTYSASPQLSVPAYRLLQRRPGHTRTTDARGRELHAIGAWLPELEFTHYLPTQPWRELIESCDGCLVVSGNVLPATAFHFSGRPYVAWVATDWEGDRKDRIRRFPFARRVLDACVSAPVIRLLEPRLLRGARVLALSEYTARMLADRAGGAVSTALVPVPVDVRLFRPRANARVPGRLGFAGRFNDPRKNIVLLLQAAALLRSGGDDAHVVLIGDAPDDRVRHEVESLGLADHAQIHPGLTRLEMRDVLQTLDVFVLPSHQEGLCIAALEAMACGVPVVSTRCGGPEEFVIAGTSGELVANDPRMLAEAARRVLRDAELRERLARGARRIVEERYGPLQARAVLRQQLQLAFASAARPGAGADVARPQRALRT